MTRTVMMFVIIFAFCIVQFNCSDDDNGQRQRRSPQEQAKTLQEELDLTEEQTKKVKTILTQATEEMAKMREKFDGDRSERREMMMEIREKINEKIEEILDDDQKEKYQEFQEEQRERIRERRRDR